MIPVSLKKIASITNGILYGKNIIIENISINTKEIIPNTLFIALKGKKFDAHIFIEEAVQKGCSAIITNRQIQSFVSYIKVQDTTIALGEIAHWLRNTINPKILAITGSCGKTSVKEMTASILKKHQNVIYSLKNENNHIGVPITLLKLKQKDKYGVIELGSNNPGEIRYISKITQPNVALINNIYHSHLSGFKSLLGISKEKSEILSYLINKGIAIINLDSHHFSQWKKKIQNKKIFYFSIKKKSDFFATNIKICSYQTCFVMHTPSGKINITLPYLGYQNISNALAASALAFSIHIPLKQIQTGLLEAPIIPGRLEPIKLSKNIILINDTYNSNVASMITSIKILEKMPGYKVLVIGDMAELGENSILYHKIIGNIISLSNIDYIFSLGKYSHEIFKICKNGKHFQKKQKDLLKKKLKEIILIKNKSTILIKGSRNMKMETIVEYLIKEYKNDIFN